MLNFHTINLYLIIATGTIMPVVVQELVIPLHTVYVAIYFFLLMHFPDNRSAFFRGILVLLPFLFPMLIGLSRADNLPYALEKIEGGVLASLLTAIITSHCVRRYGLNDFLTSYLNVTLTILMATMIYRITLGYEIGSRDGRFLINGPITYGWLMGIAAIISLFLYQQRQKKRFLIYFLLFFTTLLVTGSKGPLVALTFCIAVFFVYFARSKRILLLACCVVLSSVGASQLLSVEALGRFASLFHLFQGDVIENNYGSLGVRLLAWGESISIFGSNILWGVGLGNWENYSSIKIIYPHNFFLEIASEMGLLGLVAFAIVILALLRNRTFFMGLYLSFFLVALSFSGDMSYYRYLLGVPLGLFLASQTTIRHEATG